MVANQTSPKGKAGKELAALPEIPDKQYFSISEASLLCGVKAHVLRYWEQEFPQLSPLKRKGNRRYYQRHDLLLARQIRSLLYGEGYTIHGARERLQGLRHETSPGHSVSAAQLELEMEDNASAGFVGSANRLIYLQTELAALIKICAGKH
ncbi:MerR family transcriptional regulator [Acidithiobacillus montserratensis]|uniref:MerR family transcriptional regulator n=1 Tax=Acidithiobacillus montserratensis TaxID=2729135 RepID=A0ACD5HDM5_9PROT|nr:MerR family transcriptional regulator [Acidithiobacillus montserratensis]MBN2680748.1 MerR family transcriptional regulator [Acidithiobacillaceae bacterium]MBU2747213.1 MerR family transcriptional regulator [Acidithiobacillus montserratensis]